MRGPEAAAAAAEGPEALGGGFFGWGGEAQNLSCWQTEKRSILKRRLREKEQCQTGCHGASGPSRLPKPKRQLIE